MGKGAGEQNDERSFEGTSFGLLRASGENDELLSEQCILLQQFRARTGEVDEQAANERRAWSKRLAQSLLRPGRQFGNLGSETSS